MVTLSNQLSRAFTRDKELLNCSKPETFTGTHSIGVWDYYI